MRIAAVDPLILHMPLNRDSIAVTFIAGP